MRIKSIKPVHGVQMRFYLIAASLTLEQMQVFEAHAFALGMGVLVEVHNETELQAALQLNTPCLASTTVTYAHLKSHCKPHWI